MNDLTHPLTHRVVLVGRTNLDAALRLHDHIELLRAHHALEAVGELASMPQDIPGERTFVVVAPEVAINLEAPPALADRFVRAVRAATPGARVLVQTPLGITRDAGAFDAVLEHDDPLAFLHAAPATRPAPPPLGRPTPAAEQARPARAEATAPPQVSAPRPTVPAAVPPTAMPPARPAPPPLERAVPVAPAASAPVAPVSHAPREAPVAPAPVSPPASPPAPPPPRQRPEPVTPRPAPPPLPRQEMVQESPPTIPAPRPRPAPVAVVSAPQAAGRDTGDTSLVAMLLRRANILPIAVSLIRERLGDFSVEFVPVDAPADAAPASLAACPVVWDATTYGLLHSTRSSAPALAPHARWLASWLRLRDQQDQLHEAAFTDPLTGAWNRRYFDMFLSRTLSEARGQRRFVTVLVFDIDDFKQYNDRFGHGAGDEVLTQTVSLLRSVIRPTDRVCRIGGDEFAVIFDDPQGPRQEGSRHPRSVEEIAHRFQHQISHHRFPALSGITPGSLSISGGLATFPWDGSTPAELLKRADELALAAKREGKRAIFFGT
jgi:diguanylate cyclase (GGDEF)-like protein